MIFGKNDSGTWICGEQDEANYRVGLGHRVVCLVCTQILICLGPDT